MIEPSETKKLLCAIISKMRFPLAFFVVVIHAKLSFYIDGNNDVLNFSEWMFSSVLTRGTVMCYFFISGFLFFLKAPPLFNREFFSIQIKKRWKTLIIPFILWNIIALLYQLSLESYFFHKIPNFLETWESLDLKNKLRYLFIKPAMAPLWYLKELIFLCFSAPLIYITIKKIRVVFPIVLIISWLVFGGSLKIYTLGGLTFFTLGGYIALNNISLSKIFERKTKIIVLISYFSIITFEWMSQNLAIRNFYDSFSHRLSTLLSVILMLYIGQWLISRSYSLLDKPLLVNSAFFVYCIHGAFTRGLISFIGEHICSVGCIPVMAYFMIPFVFYSIWIFIFVVLKRTSLKFLQILAGGRSL